MMMNVVEVAGGRPIMVWAENVETGAMEQADHLAQLPFLHHHVALMPDCHVGYGMPIGGVIGTFGAVIPNAVGVDIGCGMLSVRTTLNAEMLDRDSLKRVFGGSKEFHGGIRSTIPVGFGHHSKKQDESLMPAATPPEIVAREYQSALHQIGTLGGGNHFIEFQRDESGAVWFTIHSGSRNLGFKVAKHYNDIAKALNAKWHVGYSEKWDLAMLPLDSDEGQAYLAEMNYCVEFALRNRLLMAQRVQEALAEVFSISFDQEINIAHNYATMEHHYGKDVMIHRKGATLARVGTVGIIPGSQGSHSYIVTGKGNPQSFDSCSHGAGRKMGRKEAQRSLDLAGEQAALDAAGIMHSVRGASDLDEAPGAYKDIERVMKLQTDLVDVLHTLSPIAVMKG